MQINLILESNLLYHYNFLLSVFLFHLLHQFYFGILEALVHTVLIPLWDKVEQKDAYLHSICTISNHRRKIIFIDIHYVFTYIILF